MAEIIEKQFKSAGFNDFIRRILNFYSVLSGTTYLCV